MLYYLGHQISSSTISQRFFTKLSKFFVLMYSLNLSFLLLLIGYNWIFMKNSSGVKKYDIYIYYIILHLRIHRFRIIDRNYLNLYEFVNYEDRIIPFPVYLRRSMPQIILFIQFKRYKYIPHATRPI